jgi:hypothetical protein
MTSTDPPYGFEYYKNGENLFRTNCDACHGMPGKVIDGPNMFINLFERLPSPPDNYFKRFVMDGKSLKQSSDPYLNLLEKNFNINCTHDYRNKLTQAELEQILLYVKVTNRVADK